MILGATLMAPMTPPPPRPTALPQRLQRIPQVIQQPLRLTQPLSQLRRRGDLVVGIRRTLLLFNLIWDFMEVVPYRATFLKIIHWQC
jgi:hypothetical protein